MRVFLGSATFPANPWEETKPKRAAVLEPGVKGEKIADYVPMTIFIVPVAEVEKVAEWMPMSILVAPGS